MFDFRMYLISIKLLLQSKGDFKDKEKLIVGLDNNNLKPKNENNITPQELSRIIKRINDVYGELIENQDDIRNIIDCQAVETTRVVMVQSILYTFGFLVPFILQLYSF